MWSVCGVLILIVGVHSAPRNYHSSLGPEQECLTEQNLKMEDVFQYVHGEGGLDSENAEQIGTYLMCVWKKRQIVDNELKINSNHISRYFYDIYFKLNLNEVQKEEISEAVKQCENEHADHDYELGIKIKDCIFRVVKKLPFLKRRPAT